MRKIWFKGSQKIDSSFEDISTMLKNQATLFLHATRNMAGITKADLIEEGSDHVMIRTNEGDMERSNIQTVEEVDRISIEFDEMYKAGRTITQSHYDMEFSTKEDHVIHLLRISDVQASGLLGFFYKKFGKNSIGKAVLNSFKLSLENQNTT